MLTNIGGLFSQANGNKSTTVKLPVKENTTVNLQSPVNSTKDTVALGKYKYYKVDGESKMRYIMEGINEDSLRMIKAGKADWAEFETAYNDFKKVLSNDPLKNVESYIDTTVDLVELGILNQSYFYNTSKVALKQLTANIQFLNQFLAKPIREKNDLLVLSMLLQNIELLVTKYIATKGNVYYVLKTILPIIKITLVDKAGAPVNDVKCYFISYKTCREIACRACVPVLEPCDINTINAITTRAEFIVDSNSPANLRVSYGRYHLFVIGNNKIRHYTQLNIDENSTSTVRTNEIKIVVSK